MTVDQASFEVLKYLDKVWGSLSSSGSFLFSFSVHEPDNNLSHSQYSLEEKSLKLAIGVPPWTESRISEGLV